MTVPALTINKVCLSGIDAIALADQLIRAGEFDVVVAGGKESMTQAPHLLPSPARASSTATSRCATTWRSTALGRLHRPGDGRADRGRQRRRRGVQPRGAGRVRRPLPPARRRRWKNGVFDDEVVPVVDPAAQGRPGRLPRGRGHPRRHHRRVPGRLRPAFRKDGTITAGSASQISDGAAAVVVMSKAQGRGARAGLARRDRRARRRRRPGLHACSPAGQRDPRRVRQGGHRAEPTSTWSRSTRRSPPSAGLHPGARRRPGEGQRQRRRDRARPPDRDVGARIALHLALELRGAAAASGRPRCAAAAARATR